MDTKVIRFIREHIDPYIRIWIQLQNRQERIRFWVGEDDKLMLCVSETCAINNGEESWWIGSFGVGLTVPTIVG